MTQLFDAWWQSQSDDALRVLADQWVENGEPRGLFVQLSLLTNPTAEQQAKRASLLKKKGELVGPARPFLREFEFGTNGIVDVARCEADKLAAGIDELSSLNPKLCLCVTSLKKQATIAALAKVSLERIHFITFTMDLIGSLGGSNLTDKALIGVAPAFRGVKNLGLQARGYQGECFTPEGLAKFADSLEGLEFFRLDFWTSDAPGKTALPPLSRYVEVITSHRAFRTLKAVIVDRGDEHALAMLPNVVNVVTRDGHLASPKNARELAQLKASKR